MKTHASKQLCTVDVTSSRRKCRKAHFTAPSHIRRRIMSCHLSKDLRAQYHVRAIAVRKDDEVTVMRGRGAVKVGNHKGKKGKVVSVYRKRWAIHVEKITKDKANGTQVQVPIHSSNCMITKLKIDNDRKRILDKKKVIEKDKGKFQTGKVEMALD
eukprot:TRINITY_DN9323_c0_g2_i8.p1 TRINITY_DN9323_c0_g2~~TRINITY_DN9323_c0_g2_i8.p1  ORF type:complete len:156 (+),score=41.55 TRINITY_DN9323_c0_g2_i8:61-528(+)